MYTTDPAGAENPNPGSMGHDHRSRDRGRAVLSTRDYNREVAPAALTDRTKRPMREILNLLPRKTNRDAPGKHGDCCRNGSALARCSLHRQSRRRILRPRQPVRDECGFERYDGLLVVQRSLNFRSEL